MALALPPGAPPPSVSGRRDVCLHDRVEPRPEAGDHILSLHAPRKCHDMVAVDRDARLHVPAEAEGGNSGDQQRAPSWGASDPGHTLDRWARPEFGSAAGRKI